MIDEEIPKIVPGSGAGSLDDRQRVPIRSLIELALDGLRRMRRDDGAFCFELSAGRTAPIGRSLRYTLMCGIGLRAASDAGHRHDFDPTEIRSSLLVEIDSADLRPGDLGLYLWLDALEEGVERDRLRNRLVRRLDDEGGLRAREGLELAWIVQGLAISADDIASPLLRPAFDQLLRNQLRSGLFAHYGDGRLRSRFPNFATQIYSILALATVAKLGLDDRAAPAAARAADRLLTLQLPDGGWPWLYDGERGRVVERYEVYSVHQHAMAPMGLLQLAEATGDRRYVDAARLGLRWIHGRNELGVDMVDQAERLVYRSIRRKWPFDRALLYANTASSLVLGRSVPAQGLQIELQRTCRPYELGWLLEAWCGREELAEDPSGDG